MNARLLKEFELVRARYGELEIEPDERWFTVKKLPLRSGWNKGAVRVFVAIPPGYAVTPPDNFGTDSDLRLATGAQPANTSLLQDASGHQWLQFSYHVDAGDWHPHADPTMGHNLLTFLAGVQSRLEELS